MIALPIHWQSALVSQTTKASRMAQESVVAANDPKPTISSRRQMSAFLAKKS